MTETCDFNAPLEDLTPWDWETFEQLTTLDLNPIQADRIIHPKTIIKDADSVLAVHWHPEMVPLDLVRHRIDAMYPLAEEKFVIPTQHNEIMTYGRYAGVEVDCRASAFNRKIQILLHFHADKLDKAHNLISMIAHTYRYRQTQLHEFMNALTEPVYEACLLEAAKNTGAEEDLVRFARIQTGKLKKMILARNESLPDMALKNKLLIDYLNAQKDFYDPHKIDRTIIFALGVKELVKRDFSLNYFYEVHEFIEETRALGGCIIVPHPEQFWPVLLADYDVDGYEVWNPQSREFTEFLIQTVIKKNKSAPQTDRRLLVMMGDDTHLSEKILDPDRQSPEKAAREIGLQPMWGDRTVSKILNMGNFSKINIIHEYKTRLDS